MGKASLCACLADDTYYQALQDLHGLTILVTGIYLQIDKAFWTNCGNCLLSTALQICKVEHIRRIFRTLSLLSAALLLKWSLCLNWDALRENASKTAWTSAELDARISTRTLMDSRWERWLWQGCCQMDILAQWIVDLELSKMFQATHKFKLKTTRFPRQSKFWGASIEWIGRRMHFVPYAFLTVNRKAFPVHKKLTRQPQEQGVGFSFFFIVLKVLNVFQMCIQRRVENLAEMSKCVVTFSNISGSLHFSDFAVSCGFIWFFLPPLSLPLSCTLCQVTLL